MSVNPLIEKLTQSQLRDDIPEFRAGDTVRVHARIVEGKRERIQMFEGVVIKRRGEGISATYTVRKISSGVGVERTFPVHSPRVAKIEVIRYGCTTSVHCKVRQLVFQNAVVNSNLKVLAGSRAFFVGKSTLKFEL